MKEYHYEYVIYHYEYSDYEVVSIIYNSFLIQFLKTVTHKFSMVLYEMWLDPSDSNK